MANLFLSFLGTNNYLEAVYVFNDLQKKTRFVQEATAWFTCRDWSEEDRIVIFTTAEAKKMNWLDEEGGAGAKGLQSCLDDLFVKPLICNVDIPTGASEAEIWDIFNIVLGQMHENDQIVFDITHAFRSIPLLAMTILNYAKVTKNVSLVGIYYGAFEVLGSVNQAKAMSPDKRLAPVFDLTAFDELLSWSMALDRFINTGDASAAVRLARKTVLPMLKASKGRDVAAKATDKLAGKLEAFSHAMASCRGKGISETADYLKTAVNECIEIEATNSALLPLLQNLQTHLSSFGNNLVNDGLQAVRWCMEHNLIQQGYTILEETIITWLACELALKHEDRTNRVIISQAINISAKTIPVQNWNQPASQYPEIVGRCLDIVGSRPRLAEKYIELASYRNDLNHAGMVANPTSFKNLKAKLDELLRDIEKMI